MVTVTAPAAVRTDRARPVPGARSTSRSRRTRDGAVTAAAASVAALDGAALLGDPARVRRAVTRVAAPEAVPALLDVYEQATRLTREQLGTGTIPTPRVIMRIVPVGYRVDGYTREAATVSVWRVGIIGSGSTVEPQQSWRTETVSLKWERDGWKVLWFESTPGPTPPLDSAARSSPAELFAAVPQFSEFTRALP